MGSIAKTEFELRDGLEMRLELSKTKGGALVAVSTIDRHDRARMMVSD